jgi:hypothetical protein
LSSRMLQMERQPEHRLKAYEQQPDRHSHEAGYSITGKQHPPHRLSARQCRANSLSNINEQVCDTSIKICEVSVECLCWLLAGVAERARR